jgi:hypothetical protein
VKQLRDSEVCPKWLVKHKLTKESFVLKAVPKDGNPHVKELTVNEVKAL